MCTTTTGQLQEDDDCVLRYPLTMEGEAAWEDHGPTLHDPTPTNKASVN